jgi:fucose 4-O-acetylase-like acetyltransferase
MTTSVFTWDAPLEARAVSAARFQPRDRAFDALRLVASISIVWAHTPRSPQLQWLLPLGSFGTSFFTAASIYFMTQGLKRDPQRSVTAYAEARIRKLYLPFVAWSVFYLLFRDACRYFVSKEPLVSVGPMTLLSGGQTHLWFLPFILISSLAAFPIVRAALRSAARARFLAISCALTGLMLALVRPPHFAPELDTSNFYRCAWFALPSVFWGIAIALSDELVVALRQRAPLTTMIAVFIAAISITSGVLNGVMVWEKNLAGTAWLLAALSVPRGRWHSWVSRWAPLAFGLYLLHPLILGLLRAVAQVARVHHQTWVDVANFPLTVVCGITLAWIMRRHRALRWLVP